MDEKYSSISEFKQHLDEGRLVEEKLESGWVLWQHSNSREELQQRIIFLLKQTASELLGSDDYLIQFWAVVKEEGEHHRYLSTSEQPFCVGIGGLRNRVCRYRKQCMDHMYFANMDRAAGEKFGSVGRSYQNKNPESTPDMKLYSSHDFPLRLNAARSGFTAYSAPLLCDFPRHCCGVLELLSNSRTTEQNLFSSLLRGLQVLQTLENKIGRFFFVVHHFERDHEDDDDDDGDDDDDNDDDMVQEQINVEDNNTLQGQPKKNVAKERKVRPCALLPGPLKILCGYAENEVINDGRGMLIALDDEVFGYKCTLVIFLGDIISFCDLEPTSEGCIVVYIWHLYNKIKMENSLGRFQFVNPLALSYVPNRKSSECAIRLAKRLIVASPDQVVLVPCSVGEHWILTVIEPYKNVVYLLDPISHCIREEPWEHVVNIAMSIFNANLKKYDIGRPTWEVIKVPRQLDSKRCGYLYVMRFMKEIVQGLNAIDSGSLSSLFVNEEYSQTDIDEVRIEWARCMIDTYEGRSMETQVAPQNADYWLLT